MTYLCKNYCKLDIRQKTEAILKRSKSREYFYSLLIKLFCVVQTKGLRLIVENPYSPTHYLIIAQNFVIPPTIVDKNRMLRGDYFVKPTAYWFVNCEPTHGFTYQRDKKQKRINKCKSGIKAGICSEERSMISPDYARNFICDFVLGKTQQNSQMTIFDYLWPTTYDCRDRHWATSCGATKTSGSSMATCCAKLMKTALWKCPCDVWLKKQGSRCRP